MGNMMKKGNSGRIVLIIAGFLFVLWYYLSRMSFKKGCRKMTIMHPVSVEDAKDLNKYLTSRQAVLIDCSGMTIESAQRIIDYATGYVAAVGGNIGKLSRKMFVVSMSSVQYCDNVIDTDFTEKKFADI